MRQSKTLICKKGMLHLIAKAVNKKRALGPFSFGMIKIAYLATLTARVSLITVTFTCPG